MRLSVPQADRNERSHRRAWIRSPLVCAVGLKRLLSISCWAPPFAVLLCHLPIQGLQLHLVEGLALLSERGAYFVSQVSGVLQRGTRLPVLQSSERLTEIHPTGACLQQLLEDSLHIILLHYFFSRLLHVFMLLVALLSDGSCFFWELTHEFLEVYLGESEQLALGRGDGCLCAGLFPQQRDFSEDHAMQEVAVRHSQLCGEGDLALHDEVA